MFVVLHMITYMRITIGLQVPDRRQEYKHKIGHLWEGSKILLKNKSECPTEIMCDSFSKMEISLLSFGKFYYMNMNRIWDPYYGLLV